MRVMTFSKFHEHSVQFSNTEILLYCLTLSFLILQSFCINFTIHVYHLCLIHESIKDITIIPEVPRISSIPKVRTNYGIFNIRFKGPYVWNSISENLKAFSISNFKESVKTILSKIISNLYSY